MKECGIGWEVPLDSHDTNHASIWLPQESLGGNALTTMMAALSPSKTNCTLMRKHVGPVEVVGLPKKKQS